MLTHYTVLGALVGTYLYFAGTDPYWRLQIGRGASRFLNGLCGGEGDCTFSAWSYKLAEEGSTWGWVRVWLVDALPFNGAGHCKRAYEWHRDRGLILAETEMD